MYKVSKKAFQAYANKYGVRVYHYHCDNMRFACNLFKKNVKEQGQTYPNAESMLIFNMELMKREFKMSRNKQENCWPI